MLAVLSLLGFIILLISKKIEFKKIFRWEHLLFISMFILVVIGVKDAENTKEGWFEVSKMMSFVVFPFQAVGLYVLNKGEVLKIFKRFTLTAVLAMVYALILAYYNYQINDEMMIYDEVTKVAVGNWFGYVYLSKNIGFHPVYLSYYIAFIILIISALKLRNINLFSIHKSIDWLVGVFLVICLFLLNSATIIATFLVLEVMLLLFFLFKGSKKQSIKLFLATILLVITIVGVNIISKKTWGLNYSFNYKQEYYSPLQLRLIKWDLSLKAISDHWVNGVGTGNVKNVLVDYYNEVGFQKGVENKYDPHNQFLNFWLQNGVLLFFLLVITFLIGFYSSIKTRNIYFLLFLILSLAFFTTETVLGSQRGIVFFTLIYFFLLRLSDNRFLPSLDLVDNKELEEKQ